MECIGTRSTTSSPKPCRPAILRGLFVSRRIFCSPRSARICAPRPNSRRGLLRRRRWRGRRVAHRAPGPELAARCRPARRCTRATPRPSASQSARWSRAGARPPSRGVDANHVGDRRAGVHAAEGRGPRGEGRPSRAPGTAGRRRARCDRPRAPSTRCPLWSSTHRALGHAVHEPLGGRGGTSMRSSIVRMRRPCLAAKTWRSGIRAMVPSSFMISQMTPAGVRSAGGRGHQSLGLPRAHQDAALARARRGNTWPGVTTSSGCVSALGRDADGVGAVGGAESRW